MKTLLTATAALLLSSCATHPSTEAETIAPRIVVHFTGAKDGRFPELHLEPRSRFEKSARESGIDLMSFPLSDAISCNSDKSSCKHAVVKTQLRIATRIAKEDSVQVSGALLSEMGRSLSLSSPPSPMSFQKTTATIPSEVAVIAELKNEQPFEKTLRLGESFELRGFGGVEVILEAK